MVIGSGLSNKQTKVHSHGEVLSIRKKEWDALFYTSMEKTSDYISSEN